MHQRHRESSAGAPADLKRRRFGHAQNLGTLPNTSSALRQSSLGPGTPKAGTPSGSTRGGSVGPRAALTKKGGGATTKKIAPHQQVRRVNATKGGPRRRVGKRGGTKGAEADTGDELESLISEDMGSDAENLGLHLGRAGGSTGLGGSGNGEGTGEDEEMDDGADDEDAADDGRKYCTCRGVSYGSMVACDNAECPYEWFHWSCVGITKEPQGRWYCEECRGRMVGGGVGVGVV